MRIPRNRGSAFRVHPSSGSQVDGWIGQPLDRKRVRRFSSRRVTARPKLTTASPLIVNEFIISHDEKEPPIREFVSDGGFIWGAWTGERGKRSSQ